ncbi:MAG: hypothetical protein HQL85_18695 [Magnetococcales bacterium]|nr:hypothetical protein [Magnetococcales bacterium]
MNTSHERDLKAAILRTFGALPDIRMFNNPVGEAWMGKARFQKTGEVVIQHPRRVRFGLAPGSADLIGFRKIIIPPEAVGHPMAQFLAIETKSQRGRASESQENFLRIVDQYGGVAMLANSLEDVEEILRSSSPFHNRNESK